MARSRVLGPWLDPHQVPGTIVEIDWSHRLASGLVFLCVPGCPNGIVDLSNTGVALLPVAGGAQILLPGPNGPGLAVPLPAGGGYASPAGAGCPTALQLGANLTIFANGGCLGAGLGSSGNQTIFGVQLAASPFLSYGLRLDGAPPNSPPGLWVSESSTGWQTQDLASPSSTYPALSLIGILDPIGFRVYGNGVGPGPIAYAGAPFYDSTAQVVIGEPSANGRSPNFRTDICGIYNRGISDDERAWLDAEPFVMLRSVVRRSYSVPPSTTIVNFTGTVPPRVLSTSSATVAIALAATLIGHSAAIAPKGYPAAINAGQSLLGKPAALAVTTQPTSFGQTFTGQPPAGVIPAQSQTPTLSTNSAFATPPGENVVSGIIGSLPNPQGIAVDISASYLGSTGVGDRNLGPIAPLGQFVLGSNVLGSPSIVSASSNFAAQYASVGVSGVAGNQSPYAPSAIVGVSGIAAGVVANAALLAPSGGLAISTEIGFGLTETNLFVSPGFSGSAGYAGIFVETGDRFLQPPTAVAAIAGVPGSTVTNHTLAVLAGSLAESGRPAAVSATAFLITPTSRAASSGEPASFAAAFTAVASPRALAASGFGAAISRGAGMVPRPGALAVGGSSAGIALGLRLAVPGAAAGIGGYAATLAVGTGFVLQPPTARLVTAGSPGFLIRGSVFAPPAARFAASGVGARLLVGASFTAPAAALGLLPKVGALSLGSVFVPRPAALVASGVRPDGSFGVSLAFQAAISGASPVIGYAAAWAQEIIGQPQPAMLAAGGYAPIASAGSSLVLTSFRALGVSTYGPIVSTPLPIAFTSVELPRENQGRHIRVAMLGPKDPEDSGWVLIDMTDWLASMEAPPQGLPPTPVAVNVVTFDPAYTVDFVRLVGDACYLHVSGGTLNGEAVIALQITLNDGSIFQRYVGQMIQEET